MTDWKMADKLLTKYRGLENHIMKNYGPYYVANNNAYKSVTGQSVIFQSPSFSATLSVIFR